VDRWICNNSGSIAMIGNHFDPSPTQACLLAGGLVRLAPRTIGQISQPWLNAATVTAPFAMRCLQPIVVCNQRQGCEGQRIWIGGFGDSFGEPIRFMRHKERFPIVMPRVRGL
jgi:hypothetical protein